MARMWQIRPNVPLIMTPMQELADVGPTVGIHRRVVRTPKYNGADGKGAIAPRNFAFRIQPAFNLQEYATATQWVEAITFFTAWFNDHDTIGFANPSETDFYDSPVDTVAELASNIGIYFVKIMALPSYEAIIKNSTQGLHNIRGLVLVEDFGFDPS